MKKEKLKNEKFSGIELFDKEDDIISIRKNKYYDSAKPLVSICTTIYNRNKIVERALNSVKKQDYKNFEYIL